MLPQNRCFVRGFRQFSAHLTKCHACHGICTLSPLDAALPMRFTKTTQHGSFKVLRCHAKWRWTRPKCCACHENCNALRLPHKTTFDKLRNTFECRAMPVTRNEATRRWKPPKATPVAELTIGMAIRPSHGHLRMLANVCATSSEYTLNPQTARVKREPLLRIGEELDGYVSQSSSIPAHSKSIGFSRFSIGPPFSGPSFLGPCASPWGHERCIGRLSGSHWCTAAQTGENRGLDGWISMFLGVFAAKRQKIRWFYDQFSGLPHYIPIFLDYISGSWTLLFDACMSWIHRELHQKGTWIFTVDWSVSSVNV